MPSKMRAAQISQPHGPFEIVERDIPEPGPGMVRIKVHACGICHSDAYTKEGLFPGIAFPRVPGHEVAGEIDAVAPGVPRWKPGQRVAVGWHGGHCGYCDPCRRGHFFACQTFTAITGVTTDGGYAGYMIARYGALASVPDELSSIEAAPLVCAGVTTFNSLRNAGARPGDLVAILGIGGLGHLGVQFAAKAGYRTAAIARGPDKATLAFDLGARYYIDSQAKNPAAELQSLGGAKVILATVTAGDAMASVVDGLAPDGSLIVIGAAASLTVPPTSLIRGRLAVRGWYSGDSIDSQETMAFSSFAGVRAMNEVFPFERVAEAYDRMMSGQARFRVVLSMDGAGLPATR